MRVPILLLVAAAAAGCEAAPLPGHPLPRPGELGALRALAPLPLQAPLPRPARVEDLSEPGLPRHVAVTSPDPELILDVEEVDALSPTYAQVLELATLPAVSGDRPRVIEEEREAPDGAFAVVVEHVNHTAELGDLRSYTVDTRVPVGLRRYDCVGTASTAAAASRLEATCEALQAR